METPKVLSRCSPLSNVIISNGSTKIVLKSRWTHGQTGPYNITSTTDAGGGNKYKHIDLTNLSPGLKILFIVLPWYLSTDAVALHFVKVWCPGSDCVEEFPP